MFRSQNDLKKEDSWIFFKNKTNEERKEFIFSTLEKILKLDRKYIASIDLVDWYQTSYSISNNNNFMNKLIDLQEEAKLKGAKHEFKSQNLTNMLIVEKNNNSVKNPADKKEHHISIDDEPFSLDSVTLNVKNKVFKVSNGYMTQNCSGELLKDLKHVCNLLRLDFNLDPNHTNKFGFVREDKEVLIKNWNRVLLKNVEKIKEEIKTVRKNINEKTKETLEDFFEKNNFTKEEKQKIKQKTKISFTQEGMLLGEPGNVKIQFNLKSKSFKIYDESIYASYDDSGDLFVKDEVGNTLNFESGLTNIMFEKIKGFYRKEIKLNLETNSEVSRKIRNEEAEARVRDAKGLLTKCVKALDEIWRVELLKSIENIPNITVKQKICLLHNLPQKLDLDLDEILDIFEDNPNLEMEDFKKITRSVLENNTPPALDNILSDIKNLEKNIDSDPTSIITQNGESKYYGYHLNKQWYTDWIKDQNVVFQGVEKHLLPIIKKTIIGFNNQIKDNNKTIDDLKYYSDGIFKSSINLLYYSDFSPVGYNNNINKITKENPFYKISKDEKSNIIFNFLKSLFWQRKQLSFSDRENLPKMLEIVRQKYKEILLECEKKEIPFEENRQRATIKLHEDFYKKICERLVETKKEWKKTTPIIKEFKTPGR